MQLIICYESRSSADTDYIYIHEFITYFYSKYNRKFKVSKIPLKTKGNYNRIERKIKDKIRAYQYTNKNEKQYVIFCLDTDYGIREALDYNNKIIEYCEAKKFYLIWFHRDVEEVFLKRRVKDKDKTEEATKFSKNNLIQSIDINKLTSVDITSTSYQKSNIKEVLDKIFNETFK